jgi:hypothetical protein
MNTNTESKQMVDDDAIIAKVVFKLPMTEAEKQRAIELDLVDERSCMSY